MDLEDSRNPVARPLWNALRAFFVPLGYLLQRFGVSYHDACDGLMKGYIEAARDQLTAAGEKATHSRIALLSGVTRQRVAATAAASERPQVRPMPKAIILEAWLARYSDSGRPRDLPFKGPGSFSQLVKSCTSTFSPRTALDEFEASRNVEVLLDGKVRLLNAAIIPVDEIELAAVAIQNITFHLETIRRNMAAAEKRLHEKFTYSWQMPAHRALAAVKKMQRIASDANRDASRALGTLESDKQIEQDTVGFGSYVYHKPKQ